MPQSSLKILAFLSLSLLCIGGINSALAFQGTPVVSTGANPAFAIGGGITSTASVVLQTAPTNGILMVSDVILTVDPHGNCTNTISLQTSGGTLLGQFRLGSQRQNNGGGYSTYSSAPDQIQHSFAFGLPVPAGEDLELETSASCGMSYTIAGYISAQ